MECLLDVSRSKRSSMEQREQFKRDVLRYAVGRFRARDSVRVGELADRLGLSLSHLHTLAKRHLGCSAGTYLRTLRRKYAQRLMRRTRLNTTTVAYRAGYGTRRTFFRSFRRELRRTPRDNSRD